MFVRGRAVTGGQCARQGDRSPSPGSPGWSLALLDALTSATQHTQHTHQSTPKTCHLPPHGLGRTNKQLTCSRHPAPIEQEDTRFMNVKILARRDMELLCPGEQPHGPAPKSPAASARHAGPPFAQVGLSSQPAERACPPHAPFRIPPAADDAVARPAAAAARVAPTLHGRRLSLHRSPDCAQPQAFPCWLGTQVTRVAVGGAHVASAGP
jgi:hypothetical protein